LQVRDRKIADRQSALVNAALVTPRRGERCGADAVTPPPSGDKKAEQEFTYDAVRDGWSRTAFDFLGFLLLILDIRFFFSYTEIGLGFVAGPLGFAFAGQPRRLSLHDS